MTEPAYPLLFSEWRIRSTTVANRVVFAPTCPTWVADPHEGVFTDQAVAYYEERAKAGCGLITIGGTVIHRDALSSEFNVRGLWKSRSRACAAWPMRSTPMGASSPCSCFTSAYVRCPCSRRTRRRTWTRLVQGRPLAGGASDQIHRRRDALHVRVVLDPGAPRDTPRRVRATLVAGLEAAGATPPRVEVEPVDEIARAGAGAKVTLLSSS